MSKPKIGVIYMNRTTRSRYCLRMVEGRLWMYFKGRTTGWLWRLVDHGPTSRFFVMYQRGRLAGIGRMDKDTLATLPLPSPHRI